MSVLMDVWSLINIVISIVCVETLRASAWYQYIGYNEHKLEKFDGV